MAEKVPMQPRRRLSRPVFQVTKRGLKKAKHKIFSSPRLIMDILLFISVTAQRFWIASYLKNSAFLEVAQPWPRTHEVHETTAEALFVEPFLCCVLTTVSHLHITYRHSSPLPRLELSFSCLCFWKLPLKVAQVGLNLRYPCLHTPKVLGLHSVLQHPGISPLSKSFSFTLP